MVAEKKRKKGSSSSMATDLSPAKVRELAQQCLETKGNLNNIYTLLTLCESESEETAHAAFVSMGHVYSKLLGRGDLKKTKPATTSGSALPPPPDDVKTKIATWLRENRSVYVQVAYSHLAHPEPAMQLAAIEQLMNVVRDDGTQQGEFANAAYTRILEKVVENESMSEQLLERIVGDINEFADVRYYFYKNLGKYLGALSDGSSASAGMKVSAKRRKYSIPADKLSSVITTGYSILSRIDDAPTKDDDLTTFFHSAPQVATPASKRPPWASVKEHKRAFSDCWLALFRQPMSADMHKRVLLALHKKIIPHMVRPTLLIDFLTDSYDQGGAVSILALNGLFTLITEHNLDYPDFYPKLYALFDKNLLHVKYRSRFLRLVDLFLSSTQLPSYLIAAFIKRMTRLALAAPPAAIIAIVPFAYNLLKKHPACLVMIHRESESAGANPATEDPYRADEVDPAKSRALESSLWELQSLKTHYFHTIAGMVRVFEQPIAKQPLYDLEDFLDHTYVTLMETETKKKKGANARKPVEPVPPALAAHRQVVGIFDLPIAAAGTTQASDSVVFQL
ncbi:Nucleolar complex protein 4 [Geranomyces michiganensis]|nr:Nucleolar complex protein 4 [Geranomyces michiganensis]